MPGKVTNAQVASAKFSVDKFREAVNYVNPKNKGYVRFEPDGNGGVKLAKINNKIDILVNWRTNIDSAKNQAMREKFADSMTSALKWADKATVEKLANSITTQQRGSHKGEARTDALSRKEMQTAFKTYDDMMNTSWGRKQMIDNLLKDTAARCGILATKDAVDQLRAKFLLGAGDIESYFCLLEETEGVAVGQPGHMKIDETTFMARLHALELKCDDAVKRATVDNAMRMQAERVLSPNVSGNDFGLQLTQADKAAIRGALHHFLVQKGLAPQNDDGGIVGTGGMIFNAFMEKVLPELFKKSVENVRAAGPDADKQLMMDANFSFDAILDEAEKFMIGARDYLNSADGQEAVKTGDGKFDAIIAGARQVTDKHKDNTLVSQMQKIGLKIADVTNLNAAQAGEIVNDMKGSIDGFKAAGRLGVFVQNFLAERGIGEEVPAEEVKNAVVGTTLDAIIEDGQKLVFAAKIQHGAAQKDLVTGEKKQIDTGMGDYFYEMEKAIGEIAADGKKAADKALVSKLLTYTLSNIANRKVELLTAGVGNTLHVDEAGAKEDKEQVKATADAYFKFEAGVEKKLKGALNAYDKLARALLKKGLVTQDMYNNLVQSAATKIAAAHKAALTEFFMKSPVTDADAGAKELNRILKAKLADASAEFDNDLAIAAFSKSFGGVAKSKLLNTDERVADAMAQNGLADAKLGVPGIIDDKTALARLANGDLRRLWTKTLAAHLKNVKKVDGYNTITDEFVAKVQSDFNKKAAALVKTAAAGIQKFLSECEGVLKSELNSYIDEGRGVFKGYKTCENPITKDEQKKLVDEMTAEILRFRTTALRKNIDEILASPESFEKKDVKALAMGVVDDFKTGGAERTVNGLLKIAEERKASVDNFLKSTADVNAVEQTVSTSGVFAKGGALADAGEWEKNALVSKARNSVEARMNAMPLVYASSDKSAIASKAVNEMNAAVEKPAKAWAKFRTEFLKKAAAIDANYSSLGEKNIAAKHDWVLGELAARQDFDKLDMKLALGYYENQLKSELDFRIDKVKTSFAEYAAKVEKVYARAMKELRNECESVLPVLDMYATAETREYFKTTIIPKKMQMLEFEIYRNPDNFDGAKLDERCDEVEKSFYQVSLAVFREHSLTTDSDYEKLITRAGAGVLRNDKVETAAAVADLKTWVSSSEGKELRIASEKAMLDHIVDFGASFDPKNPAAFRPDAPGGAVDKFHAAAKDVLKAHTAQMLYSAFDNTKVGEARDAFARWLDSHALSKYADYRKTTATERIMAKFAERIESLQKTALETEECEPILTPAFIAVIDQIIDSDGMTAMLSEWKAKALEELSSRYLKANDDDSAYMFDPNHPANANATSNVIEAAKRNRDEVLSVLSVKISAVAGGLVSLGGIDEMREAIGKIDMNAIIVEVNDEVNLVVDECFRRYQIEQVSNGLVQKYTHSFERQLVKNAVGEDAAHHFPEGFVDLIGNAKLSEKVRNAKGLHDAVNHLTAAINTYLGEALKHCREKCVDTYTLERIFADFAATLIGEVMKDKATWDKVLKPAFKAAVKELDKLG